MKWCLPLLLPACVVTQGPTMAERPRWRLDGDARFEGACVKSRAYLRKSGKQGFGITIELKSTGDCTVAITGARLSWTDGSSIARAGLAPLALRGRSLAYAWLPVEFDNNAAWNAGRHTAQLEVDIVVAGRADRWRIPMRQR